jgi:hypothetical protein
MGYLARRKIKLDKTIAREFSGHGDDQPSAEGGPDAAAGKLYS